MGIAYGLFGCTNQDYGHVRVPHIGRDFTFAFCESAGQRRINQSDNKLADAETPPDEVKGREAEW
jgi:hypothetical protein